MILTLVWIAHTIAHTFFEIKNENYLESTFFSHQVRSEVD